MEEESKFEWVGDLMREKPQTPEGILDILKQVNETMKEVEITVSGMREELPDRKARVLIDRVNERVLWLTTDKGMSMEIQLSRVKKARIIEE